MTRKQALTIVIGLTLLGFALRVYRLDAVSFRGDEAFTVLNWVSHPLLETLRGEIPLADPQPPLTFALFRGWSLLFGTSEFSMRILPALLNVLGIPILYTLGCRLRGRWVGVLAAALWTVHPFLIWHSQDTKAYAIWVAASAAALWLALRALDRQRRLDWLLYILVAATAAYLYYLELFALMALNLYVFIRYWKMKRTIRTWILSQIIIGCILAPWYIQPRLWFSSGYGGTTYPFVPSEIFTWLIPSLNFGVKTLSPAKLSAIWPVVLVVLLLGLLAQWRTNRAEALLLGLSGFLPVILLSLVSLKLNVFTPRYVLSVIPAYLLLVAGLIVTLATAVKPPVIRRVAPLVLAGGWLFVSGLSLYNYYLVPSFAKAPDWRSLIHYLQTYGSPDDLVVQAAADEAFTLYFDDYADFERLPANRHQSEAEITGILSKGEQNHRSIWLVARTPEDWPNAGIAPEWLATHMQEVRQTTIGDPPLPAVQYMPWQVRPDEIETRPLAEFDDVVRLVGIKTFVESEKHLEVWAYWQPLGTTDASLKVFVHLIGPINPTTRTPLWTQDDHFPQSGRISTTSWQVGETYRDIYQLPLTDVPPGDYNLEIGMYDPDIGDRLPVAGGDSYLVGIVTIPSP